MQINMCHQHQTSGNSNSTIIKLAIMPIRFYRYAISPLFGAHCRFYPSCSSYSIEALQSQGLIKGGYLSLKRILKCHPWNPGGIDLVPSNCEQQCDAETPNHQHSGSST